MMDLEDVILDMALFKAGAIFANDKGDFIGVYGETRPYIHIGHKYITIEEYEKHKNVWLDYKDGLENLKHQRNECHVLYSNMYRKLKTT